MLTLPELRILLIDKIDILSSYLKKTKPDNPETSDKMLEFMRDCRIGIRQVDLFYSNPHQDPETHDNIHKYCYRLIFVDYSKMASLMDTK